MKNYPLRIKMINICECGHPNDNHGIGFIDVFRSREDWAGGKCDICTCPKYKREKSISKKEYDEQNKPEVEQ